MPSSACVSRLTVGVLLLATLCALSHVDAQRVGGTFTFPSSTYYPNMYDPFQAFELASSSATGLIGNATTLNIAVAMFCSESLGLTQKVVTETMLGTSFMDALGVLRSFRITASEAATKCPTGISGGLYDGTSLTRYNNTNQ